MARADVEDPSAGTIEADIKRHDEEIVQLNRQLESLDRTYADYRETMMDQINNGELGSRVTAIETDVTKMRKLYSSFNSALDDITAQKTYIESRLAAFKQLEKLKEDMTALTTRCDGYDKRLDKHSKFIHRFDDANSQNAQALEAANREIDALKEELERTNRHHEQDMKALREEMAALVQQAKQETLEQLQPTVNAALEFENRFLEMEKKVKGHVSKSMKREKDANREIIEQALADMKTFEETIGERTDNLDARVTSLEGKMKEDIIPSISTLTANLKATDAAVQSTSNKIENDIRTLIKTNADRIGNNMDFCIEKFDAIETRFKGLDEFNGETTVKIRELNETVERKEEEMTKFVKAQVAGVSTNLEEHRKEANTRAAAIEQSVTDLDKKTADEYAQLEKRTKKHFASVKKSQERSTSAHDELKGTVEEQAQKMEDLTELFQAFREDLEQKQTEFNDKMQRATEDIALAADAAKRTMTSRCDDLENDINIAKKNIGETKTDIAEKFSEIKGEHQRAHNAMQTDMDNFMEEVRRLNTEIREQNDASKTEILNENAGQFAEIQEKMKTLSQIVREFVGPDGISIQSVSETMAKMRAEITELETKVKVEIDKFNGALQAHMAKQAQDLSEFQETTVGSVTSYKRDITAKLEDEIHTLKMQLSTLTREAMSSGDEEPLVAERSALAPEEPVTEEEHERPARSRRSMVTHHASMPLLLRRKGDSRWNQKLEEQISEIMEQIAELQRAAKERADTVGSDMGKLASEIETLRAEVKDTTESVEINRQASLEQVQTLRTVLEQSSEEIKGIIDNAKAQTEAQMTTVNERIQNVNEAVVQNRVGGDKTNDEVSNLKAEVTRLSSSVAKKFERNNERTAQVLEEKVKGLQDKIEKVQVLFDTLKGDSTVDLPAVLANISTVGEQMRMANEGFGKQLNDLREEFAQKVADVTRLLNEYDGRLKGEVEDLRKASHENLGEKVTALREKSAKEIALLTSKIDVLTDRQNAHMGDTNSTVPEILAMIEALRKTLEDGLKNVNSESIERDSVINATLDKLAARIKTTSTNVSTISETINLKVTQQVVDMRDEFKVIEGRMGERMKTMEENMQHFSEAFGDGGVEDFAKAVKKLKETTAEAFQRVHTTIEDIVKRQQHETRKLQKQVLAIAGGGEMNIKEISDVLENHQAEIDRLMKDQANFTDDLNEAFKKFGQKAQSKIRQIAELVSNIDQQFVGEFETVNVTINTFQMETAKSFEDTQEALNRLKQELLEKGKKRKTSVMKKLTDRLTTNEQAINQNKDAISALQDEFERLTLQTQDNGKVARDELKAAIHKLEDKTNQLVTLSTSHADSAIAKLTKTVNENQQQHDELLQKINTEMGEDIAAIKVQLEAIRGPNKVSLSAVSSSLEALQKTYGERFAQLESKTKEMDARLSSSVETLDTREGDFEGDTKRRFDEIANSINSLKEAMTDEINQGQDKAREAIESIRRKTGTAMKRAGEIVSSLRDDLIVVIDGNKATTDSQLASLRDDLKQANEQIAKNQAKVKTDLQEVSDRCTNLTQTEVSSVRKSLDDSRNELYGMLHQLTDATKSKHQRLRGEIDELRTSTAERSNEIQAALDQAENALKAMVVTSVNELRGRDTELEHTIAVIQEESRATKALAEEVGAKQGQDFASLKSDINKNKSSFQIMVDELASSVKTHMEKRKTEIRSVDATLREEIKKLKFGLTDLSESTTKSVENLSKSLTGETSKIREEVTEALAKHQLSNESLKASISEISLNLTGPITNRMEALEAKQDAHKHQLDSSDNVLREGQEKILERQTILDESIGGLKSAIDQVQKVVTLKMTGEIEKLEDKQKQLQRSIKGMTSDSEDLRHTMGIAQKDIRDLQKIKLYNREIEAFTMRFEETVAYLNNFRDTICNVIHSSFQGRTGPNGDEEFAAATVTTRAQDLPSPPKSAVVIEDIQSETEIGGKIRAALATHTDVTVSIPEDTHVFWNKTCHMRPHQTLKIVGSGKTSIIQMRGMDSFGSTSDPSRLVLDGYSVFELHDLRVEARCGSAEEEQEDLSALFVLRGWDAMGPAIVTVENVAIDSDHNIVNVGGNSCAQIQFADCRMSNSKGSETISPVVAKSGAYPSGTGNIIARNVKVAGNRIRWDDSANLVRSGGDKE